MLNFFGTRLPLKIYAHYIPGTYFVIIFVIIWCLSFITVSRCYPFSYLELDVIIFGFILCYNLVVIIFHCQQMLSFFLSRVGVLIFVIIWCYNFLCFLFSQSADVIIFPIFCWVVIILCYPFLSFPPFFLFPENVTHWIPNWKLRE